MKKIRISPESALAAAVAVFVLSLIAARAVQVRIVADTATLDSTTSSTDTSLVNPDPGSVLITPSDVTTTDSTTATTVSADTTTATDPVTPTDTTVTTNTTPSQAPQLTTDKSDYEPGESISVFGNFFQSLQNAIVKVWGGNQDDGTYTENSQNVTADSQGSFSLTNQLDSMFRPLYNIVASDQQGNQLAETSVTDSLPNNFSQCSNKSLTLPAGSCDWIGSILHDENSSYAEGMTVPQRIVYRDLNSPELSHEITFNYSYTKGGVHAYDFLTTVDPSVTNGLNPCEGLLHDDLDACTSLYSTGVKIQVPIQLDTYASHSGSQAAVESAYDSAHSATRYITVFAPSAASFNSATVTLQHVTANGNVLANGADTGDSDVAVDIKFNVDHGTCTSTSPCKYLIFFGGHLAVSQDNTADSWGAGQGAFNIAGGPYHIKNLQFDGVGGSQDNQIMGANVQPPISQDPSGSITITKVTSPSTATGVSFPFTTTGSGLSNFSLDTDPATAASNTQTFTGILPGSYSVTEGATTDWAMTNLVCTSSTGSTFTYSGSTANITFAANDNVNCTYTNTLQPRNTTVTTQLSGTSVSIGTAVHDSATIGNATSDASGSVTYNVYSGNACTGTPVFTDTETVASGNVPNSVDFTPSAAGTYNWQAVYSGDLKNNPSTSTCGTETLIVNKNSPTISTTLSDTSVFVGSQVHDSSTLSGATSDASGTVTYTVYTDNACTKNAQDGGTVTAVSGTEPVSNTLTFNTAGDYYWQAVYSGDSNNNSATSNCSDEHLVVNKRPSSTATAIYLGSDESTAITTAPAGSTVHDSAEVTGVGPTPTGSVDFTFFANGTCGDTGSSAGTANLVSGIADPSSSEGPLNAGSYSFKAHYSGDNVYLSSDSGCEPLTITQLTPQVATDVKDRGNATVTSVLLGSTVHDQANVSGSFTVPSGTVDFIFYPNNSCTADTGASAGTGKTLSSGTASSDDQGPLAAGSYSFTAHYNGDINYVSADGLCEPLKVNPVDTTVTTHVMNASEADITNTAVPLGSIAHDNASVGTQVGNFVITGQVTYHFYTMGDCSGSSTDDTVAAGSESPLTSALSAGNYSYKAEYLGDSNYNPSVGGCEPFSVSKAPTTSTTALQNVNVAGEATAMTVSDQATVTGGVSGFIPSGTASFTFFTNGACTSTGTASGSSPLTGTDPSTVASSSQTLAGAGSYSFQASYSGDSNYLPSTSSCEPFKLSTLTINKTASGDHGTFNFTVSGPTSSPQTITTAGDTISTPSTGTLTFLVTSGSYTVGETPQTLWKLVSLDCAGSGPQVGPVSAPFTVVAGTNTVCNFENTKINKTRTQGFWSTHTAFANTGWTAVTNAGDAKLCSLTNNLTALTAPLNSNQLMGGFWANIANTTTGKRSATDKARMQLLQQLLAAALNKDYLLANDYGLVAQAKIAYCGTNTNQMNTYTGKLDTFNQSGDNYPLDQTSSSATTKASKSQADIKFWDTTTH